MIMFRISGTLEWWLLHPCFDDHQKPVKPAAAYTCLEKFIKKIYLKAATIL